MNRNIISLIFSIFDLVCGIVFGMLGHFFGICCFPFLGALRGVSFVLSSKKNTESTFMQYLINALIGGFSYFLGVCIGALILVFLVVPQSTLMQEFMDGALSTLEGKIAGVMGAVVFGIVYMLIYSVSSIAGSYITSMIVNKETK